MAFSIEGAGGARWTAATWVARNAFAFLIPSLKNAGARALAESLEEALAAGSLDVSLREVLDDERRSGLFRIALGGAIAEIEREGPGAWHEPVAYGPFLASVRALATLCRVDGNKLLLELAASPLQNYADHVTRASEATHHP